MRRLASAVFALIGSFWAFDAMPAVFHSGDIIVSTGTADAPDIVNAVTYSIRQFAPDGTLIQEFYLHDSGVDGIGAADLKFNPQGILYAAAGPVVLRFANDGSVLPPFAGPSTDDPINSLAFARSGDLFATTYRGAVLKFGSDGTYHLVSGQTDAPTWADLGIDQCTLYRFRAEIGRFDVCTNTLQAPLTTELGDSARTLLVLTDGTLLASTAHADMYRIQPDGTVLRHYGTHAVAYARDFSPNFVWVSLGLQFAKFDLQNDVIAAGPFDSGVRGFSAGVVGITIVGADVQTIPTLSPLLLVFLALGVAVCALVKLRM
jgi:hypothetical protein